MMKEKYVMAAGSPAFSRKLAAIFQLEGWEATALTNEPAALRYLKDVQDIPQYLVIDKLKDWAIRLARELQPQGTQIILSGFMPETPEELQGILGVPYYSIMGLPSKVATVLLGKEVRDEEISRRLSHRREIKMMDGSIPAGIRACEKVYCRMFDKDFVERMGIDAIIDPIKRGFSESQGSWMGYIRNPARDVKLVSFMYDRDRESALTVNEYKKMMNGLIDALVYQKAKVIATFPLYLTDEYGEELPRSKDDETVMAYLTDWLQRHPDKDVRLLYVDGYAPRN